MMNIGDFARLAGVSVRMLRHYDEIGLLPPTEVDPDSGYRRYSASLLPRAHRVVALRQLGFSLVEIIDLLDGELDDEGLRRLLERRRHELVDQIDADTARLAEVERRLRLLEGDSTMSNDYRTKTLPALRVLGRESVVDDPSAIGPVIGPMFETLAQELIDANDPPKLPGVAWYDGSGDRMVIGAGYLDHDEPIGDAQFFDLAPAANAVTVVYRGAMSGIGDAWYALGEHCRREGLEPSGVGRELYHQVEGPQETWVTELQQPVS